MASRASAVVPAEKTYPLAVTRLCWRERQIATLVYDKGLATAKDIESASLVELKNATVRSILNRLVAKSILVRHAVGPYRTFFYGPGLTAETIRDAALRRVADDFFNGSLEDLAEVVAAVIKQRAASAAREFGGRPGRVSPVRRGPARQAA